MNHSQVAARIARNKELYPELYCREPNCLWRLKTPGYCPRHAQSKSEVEDKWSVK